jgi:hypothetical protein
MRAISGRSETCLRLKPVSDGTWLRDHKSFKIVIHSADQPGEQVFPCCEVKSTDKCLNSIGSTEARFALGVVSQSRNPRWQEGLRESSEIPLLLAECSITLRDLESKRKKTREENKNAKHERKTMPERSCEQESAGTARERTTNI